MLSCYLVLWFFGFASRMLVLFIVIFLLWESFSIFSFSLLPGSVALWEIALEPSRWEEISLRSETSIILMFFCWGWLLWFGKGDMRDLLEATAYGIVEVSVVLLRWWEHNFHELPDLGKQLLELPEDLILIFLVSFDFEELLAKLLEMRINSLVLALKIFIFFKNFILGVVVWFDISLNVEDI